MTALVEAAPSAPGLWPRGAVDGYRIRFRSGDRTTSGSVFLPPPVRGESCPLMTWAHCFVGLDRTNAPSLRGLPGAELKHLSAWLRDGFAVAVADYAGLDGHGLAPFPGTDSIARDIAGICSAARELDGSIGTDVIAAGFCQGASAVLRVGVPVVALAPPDYLSYFDGVTRDPDVPADALILVLLAALRAEDPDFRPDEFLTDAGNTLLDTIVPLSMREMRRLVASVTVRDLGVRDVTDRTRVAGQLAHPAPSPADSTPVLLCTVDGDPLTPAPSVRRYRAELAARGSETSYRSYPGQHMDILSSAAADAVAWANDILERAGTAGR
ncbi:hypothetical protein BJY24_006370 [Nocardia transvalensis]|uniref:Uncharacterized protein n=1 Tax=Nocardia transvalensis TaxID=37333 RepID=A0A7W9PKP1_9NOCA|nr:hypothetical protein [Nocardia transvalensis]MBB5917458.1 hypothetical protein [Nocardia transvalensis]